MNISTEICLMGGLGNQLFQFAFGRCLSNFGEYRLIFDDSHPSVRKNKSGIPDLCGVVNQKYFDIHSRKFDLVSSKFRNLAIRNTANDSLRSAGNREISRAVLTIGVNRFSNKNRSQIVLARDLGDYGDEPSLPAKNVYFIGYCQTGRYFSKIMDEDPLTKNLFRQFVEAGSKDWSHLKPKQSAILHLRRGDYRNSKFGILSSGYYKKALQLAEDQVNILKIYAVSDENSAELLDDLSRISDRIELIPSDNLSAAKLLGLISQFRVVIGANSSLSWWAAALGGVAHENVGVFPKEWFKDGRSPQNILLQSWETVSGKLWRDET